MSDELVLERRESPSGTHYCGHELMPVSIHRKRNYYRIDGDCIIAKTLQGSYFFMSVEDEHLLKRFVFHRTRLGYLGTNGRLKSGKFKSFKLHRLVLNAVDGQLLDHINRKTFDNRRENLRLITRSGNALNSKLSTKNSSGYRGVTYHKQHKKWYVQLVKDYKHHFIGLFTSKKEAVIAYNVAVVKLHGEYAKLNTVMGDE